MINAFVGKTLHCSDDQWAPFGTS